MKKKENAKQRRDRAKAMRRSTVEAAETKRNEERRLAEEIHIVEEEVRKKQKEEEKRLRAIKAAEKADISLAKKTKTSAKAAGLKSTFVIDDKRLLMTSFGKCNRAIADKYIDDSDIKDAGEEASLRVERKGKNFQVSGRKVKDATADNPLRSKKPAGQDQIFCKDQLEHIYFGTSYVDNIHIQLIYNILDIEKILAVQVNNIVYELNNILREDKAEYDDLIGYMSCDYTFERFKKHNNGKLYEKFRKLIGQPQLGYFGKTFIPYDKAGKKLSSNAMPAFEEKCYNLLSVIGTVRQATAHGSERTRAKLYQFEKEFDGENKGCRIQARRALESLYRERVCSLNSGFLDMSGKDLYILFNAFDAFDNEKKKQIVREYYNFLILKAYKNMGFSIKKLREKMIARCAPELASDDFRTVRQKLYRFVDFAIYRFYLNDENRAYTEEFVASLRASVKASEKEAMYQLEAERLWKELKSIINERITTWMDGERIAKIKKPEIDKHVIDDIAIPESANPFCEMIYLLTIFLDGKEINDMLTQLISRFENIAGFIDVLKGEGMDRAFAPPYGLFDSSDKIAEELRIINSFARMTKEDPSAKPIMYKEAAQVLGFGNEEELEDYVNDMLDKDHKGGMGFRNFIANNVIESSRFKYLVRYGNPKKVRAIAENRKVVDFVLKEIPDPQIQAYYSSCTSGTTGNYDEMRGALATIITGLHFKDFEDVVQGNNASIQQKRDKERKKNIIRLYLTVLYLAQKNLIYVNSRYFLAFHCAERDAMTYDSNRFNKDALWEDRAAFAKAFIAEHPKKKRVQLYLYKNISNSDVWSFRAYRNLAEHLGAIRNMDKYIEDIRGFESYFELYHYLMQRSIIDRFRYEGRTESGAEGKLLEYFELVEKYNTYCKDFVKALNIPFSYNLARYKNLSVNELIDRNNYLPNKEREKDE